MLNVMDPPQHTRLRARIRRHFAPARVAALEPEIRAYARACFEALAPQGACDAIADFSARIATHVTCVANGFPLEDGEMLNGLVQRFFGREEGVDGMTEDGLRAAVELTDYFAALIRARRSDPGDGDDVIGDLIAFVEDGAKLDDETIGSHLSMLMIGGAETFPKVFASAVHRLDQHPDQRALLVADPKRIPDAWTEVLRYDMPTQFLGRTLLRDVEIHGEKLREGQAVLFLYPSANRDDREFPEPDRFDILRRPTRILSFGHGTHACIGAHFARLEGRIALELLLERAPGFRVEHDRVERLRTEFVQGFATMPITFEPS